MRASLLLVAGLVASTAPLDSQTLTGTYRGTGGDGRPVTVSLEQVAAVVRGSISAGGVTFRVEAEVEEDAFFGTALSNDGALYVEGMLDGPGLMMILAEMVGGMPAYESAVEISFDRVDGGPMPPTAAPAGGGAGNSPAPGAGAQPGAATSPPATGPGAGDPIGSSARDRQLGQLLLSSPWCYFSYSSGGGASGSTDTERAVFQQDGLVYIQSGGESYYSGEVRSQTGTVIAQGSTAGQAMAGQALAWRVQSGTLSFSADRAQWVPVQLQVNYNSNGYPILVVDGKEYAMCN